MNCSEEQRPIVVFDGVCVFCNRWVHFLLERDRKRRFIFTHVQSESGAKILQRAGFDASKIESLLYLRDGEFHTKSSAAIKIMADLGGPWRLFLALQLIPRSIRDLVYSAFARRRYTLFGQLDRCARPPPDRLEQFLE